MTEYARHLEEYIEDFYREATPLPPDYKWGDRELAEEYLRKYWLPEQEYFDVWKPIQDRVFRIDKKVYVNGEWIPDSSLLPDIVFPPEFKMIAMIGGCLFGDEDFKQLQKALLEMGEKYFVVIQRSQEVFMFGISMFRMKFPVNITWEELTSGNYISAVLVKMLFNEYFVFGKTGNWGKYVATDYVWPLDIIGFKPKLSKIFEKHIVLTDADRENLSGCLPQNYRERIGQ